MLRQPLETDSNEPLLDQDNELLAKFKEYRYGPEKMTWDPNCYECKVRYRDPKAKDLVMYLHAWRYKVNNYLKLPLFKKNYIIFFLSIYCSTFPLIFQGPDWQFQTQLPEWAREASS